MRLVQLIVALVVVAATMPAAPGAQTMLVNSKSTTTPVAVGQLAPDFTLTSHDGGVVTLSKRLVEGPAVIVFYRGSWCPFCVKQLTELQSLGAANVFAISVDSSTTSAKVAARIAKEGPLSFALLSDQQHATIDAYGLHDPAYDGDEFEGIPRAAVYVVGKDRRVVWSRVSEDYKNRPSVGEIQAALSGI